MALRLPGALFLPLLLGFPALFFFGDCGVRDNADARRQSLLLAFFLAALDVDIDVVGVSLLLFIGAPLLRKAALVVPFAIGQVFDEISVHVATNFSYLEYSGLQRLFLGKGKLLHAAQERDDVIDALVQQNRLS